MRPKPTLARVNKMIKCSHFAFERDDIRLEWIDVLKAYIAQEEELEGVKGELDAERIVLNHHSQMIDQLKEKGEQLCCRVGVLEMENQALKASMETEYIERQAKHIQALVGENEALKEALKKILGWRERDRESMGEIIHYIEELASQALKEPQP